MKKKKEEICVVYGDVFHLAPPLWSTVNPSGLFLDRNKFLKVHIPANDDNSPQLPDAWLQSRKCTVDFVLCQGPLDGVP